MDAHGLQDLEHVLASWAKKSEEDSGQNEQRKIIYAYHEAKKAIKLDIIELDEYERDHKKEALSENGLCRYLYQLDEEQGDREKKLMTICEVKIHRDITESLKSQAIAFSCNCKMDLRELSYVKNWCLFQRIPKYLISG